MTFEIDRLVDAGKIHPDIHNVLQGAYVEIKTLRSKVNGLEYDLHRMRDDDVRAFQKAICEAVKNADHSALMAAVDDEADRRVDW